MTRQLSLLPMVMQRMIDGANNFVLVAVPMFMLAGNLMNAAGITKRLIALANGLVGWLRGGLAHVTIVVSMIFAGITGIATAETVALGTTLIPAMEKQGYDKRFATGLICMASCIGPIIPPSVAMVLFSVVGEVSDGQAFCFRLSPGHILGLSLMGLATYYSHKRNYPIYARFSIVNLVSPSSTPSWPSPCRSSWSGVLLPASSLPRRLPPSGWRWLLSSGFSFTRN